MNGITPIPLNDPDAVNKYIAQKLPEWHERQRTLESDVKELKVDLKTSSNKIGEMHEAFVGTADGTKRGYNLRLTIVETWKKTVNWAVATIYLAAAGGFFTWIFTKGK